eukprot:CAMPEP_0172319906 /NCGR_PEP_ID=MMETSP1058-20130122/39021_1 /TAXON_ID=83371 /ORGANISM="Detonula confervacea, Strain CCMP 353" /LENGTH=300 /DNA_ID=CAMNT_0013035051 /DNA_START=1 /DNA_END=903 /DNA_ORIENTATION=+
MMSSIFSYTDATTGSSWAAGKTVLITGASAGIGAELARDFAKEGASLALLARNKDRLSAVSKECTALGSPNAQVFSCDLTNDQDIKSAFQSAVDIFGHFDIVILNAGRSMGCYFQEIKDIEQINYMLRLNINGVINSLFYALPSIPKLSSSRIVVISSVAGILPVPYRTVYCASKHALAGFSNSLRIELTDTYGKNAPAVQLINFPEVKGTNLNSGRMNFGAERPPAEFKTEDGAASSTMATVEEACASLVTHIKLGTNEWGQPLKVTVLSMLRNVTATIVDSLVLKTVKKSHHRPDESN